MGRRIFPLSLLHPVMFLAGPGCLNHITSVVAPGWLHQRGRYFFTAPDCAINANRIAILELRSCSALTGQQSSVWLLFSRHGHHPAEPQLTRSRYPRSVCTIVPPTYMKTNPKIIYIKWGVLRPSKILIRRISGRSKLTNAQLCNLERVFGCRKSLKPFAKVFVSIRFGHDSHVGSVASIFMNRWDGAIVKKIPNCSKSLLRFAELTGSSPVQPAGRGSSKPVPALYPSYGPAPALKSRVFSKLCRLRGSRNLRQTRSQLLVIGNRSHKSVHFYD